MGDELWLWRAVDLARAIRAGKISSREAVESCLARLDAVNPAINAVVDIMADQALAAADRADKTRQDGEPMGALHGVPITVKINVDVAGRATTNGVVAFKDAIAHEDSVPVANLRKAGAIVFGRTNVPAFSTRYFTDNVLHGRTLNPWDPALTPGGSSGGAAAAVVTGIGPIAHGNDRAGSVRFPAYASGVFGLRASTGRIADYNPSTKEERGLSSQLMHIQGPLARNIADLRLGYTALARGDTRDPLWVPAPLDFANPPSPHTAAVVASSPTADVHPHVADAVRRAGHWLQGAGYRVEEAAPPHFDESGSLFWSLLMAEERAATDKETAASNSGIERFGDDAVKRTRASTRVYAGDMSYEEYIRALARRNAILRDWQAFLLRHSVIVMPVSWQPPWPIDFDQGGDEAVRRMLDAHHPMLAISLLGLPGLAVPMGIRDGVPTGVQIVGPRFGEELCLRAGEVIEAHLDIDLPIDPKG
jgi:amidase